MTQPLSEPSRGAVFFAPISAIFFIVTRPRLLAIAVMPWIINMVLFALIVASGNYFVAEPYARAVAFLGGDNLGEFLGFVIKIIVMLLLLAAAALICYLLVIPISAPFCDKLSELTEYEMLRGRKELRAPSQTIWQGVRHAIPDALRRVAIVVPVMAVLFVIGFIPVCGAMVAIPLSFLFNSLFLGLDGYSYAMDRRFIKFPAKWAFLRQNRDIWVPFGMCLGLFALLPCNIVWLPMVSSVAATRLYCDRLLRLYPAASAGPDRGANKA